MPVARASTLLRYPQVRKALEGLAGRISAADMREMNHAADALHENPADIARASDSLLGNGVRTGSGRLRRGQTAEPRCVHESAMAESVSALAGARA